MACLGQRSDPSGKEVSAAGCFKRPQAASKVVVSGEAYGFLPDSRHGLFGQEV
jgi:hypothetical protein